MCICSQGEELSGELACSLLPQKSHIYSNTAYAYASFMQAVLWFAYSHCDPKQRSTFVTCIQHAQTSARHNGQCWDNTDEQDCIWPFADHRTVHQSCLISLRTEERPWKCQLSLTHPSTVSPWQWKLSLFIQYSLTSRYPVIWDEETSRPAWDHSLSGYTVLTFSTKQWGCCPDLMWSQGLLAQM